MRVKESRPMKTSRECNGLQMLLQSFKNRCPLIGWKISSVSKPSERDLSILSSDIPNLSIYMLT